MNDALNEYLGIDYGKSPKKQKEYDDWVNLYQPFHWFAEFYEIIDSGGFDIIIGNPPYVESSKVLKKYKIKNYITLTCGNLYAHVMERCHRIIKKFSYVSMIIPLASFSTKRMFPLQQIFYQNGDLLF